MLNAIIALIYTAYGLLQSEIEARQKQAADVSKYLKVLYALNACGLALKDDNAAGLEAVVFALNRAKDASVNDELMVVGANETLTPEKLAKLDGIVKKEKAKK